jgi:hypothetical protein
MLCPKNRPCIVFNLIQNPNLILRSASASLWRDRFSQITQILKGVSKVILATLSGEWTRIDTNNCLSFAFIRVHSRLILLARGCGSAALCNLRNLWIISSSGSGFNHSLQSVDNWNAMRNDTPCSLRPRKRGSAPRFRHIASLLDQPLQLGVLQQHDRFSVLDFTGLYHLQCLV